MSDSKVKVRDLALELGMQGKDMLGIIKELGIQARAATSVLADEEIARIRARVNAGVPEKREPQNDIIVRRRKRVEAPEEQTPVQAEAAPQEKAEPAPEAAPARISPKEEPAALAAAPDVVEKEEPAKVAEEPKAKESRVVKEVGARIIRRPEPEKTPAPAESASPAKEDKPAPPPEDKARPSRQAAFAPNLSAEPERGADGSAVSSAPAPRPERDESTPRFEGDSADDTEDDSGRKRKKRREDPAPASQVRVISRPDPAQQRPAAPARRDDFTPGAGRPGGPRPDGPRQPRPFTPGGPRPSAPGGPRPFTPGGPRPSAPGGPPALPGQDASKKKRQKGRRTVDFGGESAGFDRRFKEDGGDGNWSRPAKRGKGRKGQQAKPVATQPIKAAKRKIRMEEFIRVSDLAHQMALKSNEIIKVLFGLGVMATINQSLDVDTATLVAAEFDYEVEKVGFSEETFLESRPDDDPAALVTRPPVVTIMGHVDHGKTSLLDAIRKASVASGEAGGITQHIGAYHVKTKKGDIVFLDTPGHEAFTAMRARGAEVTDIVVLVVAADDGVMEQTREAINHAKAAGVPIMVAVNKMDKPEANPDRVKRELAEQGLVPEEWGGDITFSYVSAKTRLGLDELMELLALQAEILELKANPDKPARGHIVEAKLDKGRGSLGTILIQEGTLRVGDSFVCGVHFGRVRAMFDDQGKKVKEAGPSMPVEVQGFEGVPQAGDEFICIADEKTARRIADTRAMKQRERDLAKESKVTLETFLAQRADSVEALNLNLVVKADVQGSLEAILDAMRKLSTDKVRIEIIHGGAGAISESDVLLAAASNAIIIGFNVRPTTKAKELAEQEKVELRFYDIIYKLVEEVKSAMQGMLAPVSKEVYLGSAEVRDLFSVPKVGTIAGCHVSDGKIVRNSQIRLLRDGVVVHTGRVGSLRRFKDDVREVLKGYECGIGLDNYNDVKAGDVIEAFEIVEEAATL